MGGFWLAGGAVVTLVTYVMAASSSGGGTYFVFFGPMIFGTIRLVESWKNLRRIDGQIAALHRGTPAPWRGSGVAVVPAGQGLASAPDMPPVPGATPAPPPVPPPPFAR